jgi:hypothetical protein
MTPASTDAGESTATLRPPAAAITKASFAAIEVMSSTFPNFFGLKKFLLDGVPIQPKCSLLVPNRRPSNVVSFVHTHGSWELQYRLRSTKKPGWNAGLLGKARGLVLARLPIDVPPVLPISVARSLNVIALFHWLRPIAIFRGGGAVTTIRALHTVAVCWLGIAVAAFLTEPKLIEPVVHWRRSKKSMNILGPIIISASAATLSVIYGAPSPSTEVQSKQIPQDAANPAAPVGVDAFCGREPTGRHNIRVVMASPYCR